MGTGDVTLDMNGWKKFASDFNILYQSDIHSGIMDSGAVIISDYWFPAGHLDHYYAIPYHHNLIVFGSLESIHHFAWLNDKRPRIKNGSDAYFVYPTNNYGPPNSDLKNDFVTIDDSILIPQFRSGKLVRNFVIYRMHHFHGDSASYLIPGIK
jgi:hypothetical protein